MRPGGAIGLVGAFGLLLSSPGYAQPEGLAPELIADTLFDGVQAALQGRAGAATKAFDRVEAFHPHPETMVAVHAMAHLLAGHPAQARRLMPETDEWALYRAMAELGVPGGKARARGIVAQAAKSKQATAGVLFFAALAFAQAGQAEVADAYLVKAAARSDHALAADWAPDPAEGLAQAALRALEGLSPAPEARVRLAEGLRRSGRRGSALLWAARAAKDASARPAALKVTAQALFEVGPPFAQEAVRDWVRAEPKDALARLLEAELAIVRGETKAAQRALGKVEGLAPDYEARRARAEARVALADGRAQDGLTAARAAVRQAPKDPQARALLAEALLQTGEADRAAALLEALLRSKTTAVNPYALLVKVRTKQQQLRNVAALELRSQAFEETEAAPRRAVAQAEKVFTAVRDAEAGLGASGLLALRGQDPRLGLPIDLALARLAKAGVARQARDRILLACGPHWTRLLQPKGGWDRALTAASEYGRAVDREMPLSAADPFRCRGAPLRVGGATR